jgi:hypothetical protein
MMCKTAPPGSDSMSPKPPARRISWGTQETIYYQLNPPLRDCQQIPCTCPHKHPRFNNILDMRDVFGEEQEAPVIVNRRRKRAVSNEEELDRQLDLYHRQTGLGVCFEGQLMEGSGTLCRDNLAVLYRLREGIDSFLQTAQNRLSSVQRLTESLSIETKEARNEIADRLSRLQLKVPCSVHKHFEQGSLAHEARCLDHEPRFDEDYFVSLGMAEESITEEEEKTANKNIGCLSKQSLLWRLEESEQDIAGITSPMTITAHWITWTRFILVNLILRAVKAVESVLQNLENTRFSGNQGYKREGRPRSEALDLIADLN